MQLDGQPGSDAAVRVPKPALGGRKDEVELLGLKVLSENKDGQHVLLRHPLVLGLLHGRRQQSCASVAALVTTSRNSRHGELGDGKGHASDGGNPHVPDRVPAGPVVEDRNADGTEDVPASGVSEVKNLAAGRTGDRGGIGLVGMIDLRAAVMLPVHVAVFAEHVATGKDDSLGALGTQRGVSRNSREQEFSVNADAALDGWVRSGGGNCRPDRPVGLSSGQGGIA